MATKKRRTAKRRPAKRRPGIRKREPIPKGGLRANGHFRLEDGVRKELVAAPGGYTWRITGGPLEGTGELAFTDRNGNAFMSWRAPTEKFDTKDTGRNWIFVEARDGWVEFDYRASF